MTEEVITQVNYRGPGEKSLLNFQNQKGGKIGESHLLNNEVIADAAFEVVSDIVKNVTGVDQQYKRVC